MNNQSKIGSGVGAVAMLAAGYFLFLRPHKVETPQKTGTQVSKPVETPGARAKGLASKPLELPPPPANDTRSKECREFLKRVASIDMTQLGYLSSRTAPEQPNLAAFPKLLKEMKLGNGCGKLPESDPLGFSSEDFMRLCGQLPEILEEKQLGLSRLCMDKLYALRLQAFADAYKDVPAAKLTDPALVSLIMRGTPTMSGPGWPDRYLELARRRAELDNSPESNSALTQASYTSLLLHQESERMNQAAPLSSEEKKKLEAEITGSVEKLEQSDPGNVRAFETRLLLARMKGDTEEMKKLANERIERGENVAEATFYLAQSAFMSGDKAAAKKQIEKLLTADPKNPRYQHAIEGIDRAPAQTGMEAIFGDRNTTFGLEEGDPFGEAAPR